MTDIAPDAVPSSEIAEIVRGTHVDPHRVLGAHPADGHVTIRTVRPLADAVAIRTERGLFPAEHVRDGMWAARVPGDVIPDYRVQVTYGDVTSEADDPYRFLPTLGELDLHLIAEGRHEEVADLPAAEVEHVGAPVGLLAEQRVRMLVERGPVEARERPLVLGEVGGHPVDDDADAGRVQPVHEVAEVVRTSESRRRRVVRRHLIAP